MGQNRYDVKRGHFKNIEGDKLKNIIKEYFGDVREDGEKLSTSYGAIEKADVWLEGKTGIWVDLEMKEDVPDDVAMDTVSRWNKFLFDVTGFNAKNRRDRAKKKAKSG